MVDVSEHRSGMKVLRIGSRMLGAAFALVLQLILTVDAARSQERDKCGFDEFLAKRQLEILGSRWGYGYDSLLADLPRWSASPYVSVQSIGKSVRNRDLWELTITAPDSSDDIRRTVYVHARTHPNEVQSFWVTSEMIRYLLGEEPLAQLLRSRCTFHIVPMYNPDGVELEYARQNANGIDIESNWDKNPVEPEVAALRLRFIQLMASPAPIEIALNMHSSYDCVRYFVFHDSVGTSAAFTVLEKKFINGVSSHFPGGFAPWNFFVSWKTGTPTHYPESWFWMRYREAVMALTYEDMNCSSAGDYDRTAYALLHGVADYLGLTPLPVLSRDELVADAVILHQSYPNPVAPGTGSHTVLIRYELPSAQPVRLVLYDVLGRRVMLLEEGDRPAGVFTSRLDVGGLGSGMYFYRLETPHGSRVQRLVVSR